MPSRSRAPRRASGGIRPESTGPSTRAIHGRALRAFRGPVAPPIFQTSTYRFADSGDAIRYAEGDPEVYVYSRYHNPTVHAAEERLALLYGSEKSLLFSSGMAAITSSVLAVVRAGEEILSTPSLYGGTYRFFRDILPRHDIRVRYIAPDQVSDLSRHVSRRTRLVYTETPTNPTLGLVDLAALVRGVRSAGSRHGTRLLTMVDNTFATVLNQNPFAFGVDIVVESATKYLGGHSDLLGGVAAGPVRLLTDIHNQLKYYGGAADPFAAFLLLRSLKTLTLRVQHQNENALALAHALETMGGVRSVIYPGLRSHPQHALARRQMVESGGAGYGGMVTIEVTGGARGAARVCDRLCVAVNAMSLGGVETLVSVPVYSSHVHMSRSELSRHGVRPGMIRISTGVENIEDLVQDFRQALGA